MTGLSKAGAWLVLAVACAVVAGWMLDIRLLTSIAPGYNTMKFNTAVCLVLLAAAVLLWSRPLSLVLAVAVALLATATLVEITFSRSFGIDELIFRDIYVTGAAPPGRMALATALSLLALSLAIWCVRAGRRRLAETLIFLPLLASSTAVLGYLYDAEQFYSVASLASVAVHTAATLLILSFALLAAMPDGLLSWAVTSRGPGATMVRQTAPVIVAALTLVGFVQVRTGVARAFGEHFGVGLMVLVGIAIAIGVSIRAAVRLDNADGARGEAERSLSDLVNSLTEGRNEAWDRAELLADELARERRRFDRAVASTDSVVWTVETTAGQHVPVYVSPNAVRVLGDELQPGETATAALARLVDEDQRPAALEFRRKVREGETAEVELRLSVSGRAKWVRVHGVPRPEPDRTFYDGIMTDSTAEHAIGEQRELLLIREREQIERLSEMNRVRDEFMAVAGHELRTPVAVILGYTELISEPNATAETVAASVEVIARRAHQLNELVERVFDLAKIDSGAMELDPEEVSALDFVADLLASYRPHADAAGISLTAEVAPASVIADWPRLQQVFDNLLSNALKYTPTGGHVTLTVSERDDQVVFDLADDGIGVKADELPQLFDRLFRASNAREARIPGTGLGLAVTKALVEAHHGTITATSNLPQGMVFSITLPGSHRTQGVRL